MKTISLIFSLIIANTSYASITQPVTALNDPQIRVLGGNQRNGVAAIEQVFTNVTLGLGGQYQAANTISLHDYLPFAQGFARQIASSKPFVQVALPNKPVVNIPPAGTNPPVNVIPPVIEKPVTPVTPVPEPETVLLMAMGVSILLTRQIKKAK